MTCVRAGVVWCVVCGTCCVHVLLSSKTFPAILRLPMDTQHSHRPCSCFLPSFLPPVCWPTPQQSVSFVIGVLTVIVFVDCPDLLRGHCSRIRMSCLFFCYIALLRFWRNLCLLRRILLYIDRCCNLGSC
ncbi:hypothetical protein BO78DRAFT_149730 [Aspergillus sclerotiicarbonarius CBS 121057]|uniref:Uncharacterized protein n=1 Tax=Aspergillus sclerotiicarbonarius (strain CBS 121057 / IBT 28362) TaxID=1448318 RepID=A0A319E5G7_ASPSB|nr:hypothetical protein BO78DRAFT_149730 [Aspergillus sclerotiicarbonarius CBS 121057]